jgi:NAD(P)-dependent dehydrogenase (short-subunit alcohol dehydrogenase family)
MIPGENMKVLDGKVAIVTGASKGIGARVAHCLKHEIFMDLIWTLCVGPTGTAMDRSAVYFQQVEPLRVDRGRLKSA